MRLRQDELVTIEGELRVPTATAQLARFDMGGPREDTFFDPEALWLDLCLTPRPLNTRARCSDRWSPHHFERVGNLFVVPAKHAYLFRSDGGGPQTSVVCQLQEEPLRAWFDDDLEWTDRRLEAGLNIANPHIRGLLLRLGEEIRHPGFASEVLVELIAAQLAIELGRYCAGINDGPTAGGLAPWRLRLIDERLSQLCAPPTLAELANLCQFSVRQLTRGFRTSRGCSIGDYVSSSRIDNAKRLLDSDESIKAIAYSMGFASPSGFCYAFRRATGETPRQFRQRGTRARRWSEPASGASNGLN